MPPPLPTALAPWSAQDDAGDFSLEEQSLPKTAETTTMHPRKDALPPAQTPQNVENLMPAPEFLMPFAPSAIEALYAARAGAPLTQFGYDLFALAPPNRNLPAKNEDTALLTQKMTMPPSGAVQDDFVLGSGDELEILFTGQRTDHNTYKINAEGLIIVPDFPPVPAAGKTIGQLRAAIESTAKGLYNTVPYVSLASVRQIDVLIVGHAAHPGRQTLTVFHTVLDVLSAAGGVQKTGSLRQIKLIRGQTTTPVDLYDILLGGGHEAADLRLRDGDKIIIPPIGPTVAVAGEVKRAGIYELPSEPYGPSKKDHAKLTLKDMLALGGGVLAPGKNRFLHLAITPQGREIAEDVQDSTKRIFGEGALLMVSKGAEKRSGTVELAGHARRAGLYALAEKPNLSDLLSGEDVLGPDIYPLIGVIARWNKDQLARNYLEFPVRLTLKGEYDRKLKDGDVVTLFSNAQIRNLGQTKSAPKDTGEDFIEDPVLAGFLKERAVLVRGAVRAEGAYPVAKDISLESLLSAAGGLKVEADSKHIEVTSAQKRTIVSLNKDTSSPILLRAGDAVRVNQKFDVVEDKSVLIRGAVRSPGRYDLIAGDTLSDLIARAGGLTPQAYPFGAIFSRESERKAEEARFRAQARTIEEATAEALASDDEKANAQKIAEARALAKELSAAKGVGRITVEATPEKLGLQPELDILLEAGDRLFIPTRTLTVRVGGEVLSPASLQFREGKSAEDYIREAGGFTHEADEDRTFMILPDGSAQPLSVSSWNYTPVMIPPGTTIVVPRDPAPFDFLQSAKDVSQILSNLAVTAIFVDDVSN